ncbi:hypothetical protein SD77_2690 [Bacillus badius]|uniref:Uncharacterized protein n=1 Tax=Bacillus badius TaxID=1455 RepID=A0ABR5ARH1_BACBA|nr:hypothetical protein SD77_2690 [Bacillus badius]
MTVGPRVVCEIDSIHHPKVSFSAIVQQKYHITSIYLRTLRSGQHGEGEGLDLAAWPITALLLRHF